MVSLVTFVIVGRPVSPVARIDPLRLGTGDAVFVEDKPRVRLDVGHAVVDRASGVDGRSDDHQGARVTHLSDGSDARFRSVVSWRLSLPLTPKSARLTSGQTSLSSRPREKARLGLTSLLRRW